MSWDGVARSLGCGKATVSKCAARMRESGIGAAELEGMTDADVSALFEDGRSRRSEGYLEPDYERVCDQLARVPKMALALQWARYVECNPGGKRLYQYSQFCRLVGDYARTHDLAARIEHEPGAHDARRLGGRHRLDLRPRDGQALPRVNVNPSFTDSTNAIAPIAPTHPRRFRRRQAPFPASRSGARSFVR